MEAIERMRGFACHVNDKQWTEIINVAEEVNCPVCSIDRHKGTRNGRWPVVGVFTEGTKITVMAIHDHETIIIPFYEFVAKLKGSSLNVEDFDFSKAMAIESKICQDIKEVGFISVNEEENPKHDNPFAEQVAANIIKISCNKDIPYADKMNMVVQAILEFERNPKNQQPKNEKA